MSVTSETGSTAREELELDSLRLDNDLKRKDLQNKSLGGMMQIFANPITLAIVGGVITALTSIVSGYFTANLNRALEDQKLQAELIKKFVEGPNPAVVRENLQFLVDSNLIPNYSSNIQGYLRNNPESAPQVGAIQLGGVQGTDDTVAVSSLPSDSPLTVVAGSVAQILHNEDGQRYVCTGFFVRPDVVLTAGFCAKGTGTNTVSFAEQLRPAKVAKIVDGGLDTASYAVLKLDHPLDGVPLLSSSAAPLVPGDPLSMVMLRNGAILVADSSIACRALVVEATMFVHRCDAGGGTSGSPIVRAGTTELVGIHAGGGRATRIDAVDLTDLN